jgi:hypothetical protein
MKECQVIEIPSYIRPKQAWELLNIGPTKFWALVKEGKLEAVKISKGVTLVSGASIKSLIESAPRVHAA